MRISNVAPRSTASQAGIGPSEQRHRFTHTPARPNLNPSVNSILLRLPVFCLFFFLFYHHNHGLFCACAAPSHSFLSLPSTQLVCPYPKLAFASLHSLEEHLSFNRNPIVHLFNWSLKPGRLASNFIFNTRTHTPTHSLPSQSCCPTQLPPLSWSCFRALPWHVYSLNLSC